MIIILPLPDAALNPNRSNGRHWGVTSQIKKQTFSDAFYAVREKYPAGNPIAGDIALTLTFVLPDKRRHDRDNLLASCKAALDGIAKAMGIDDNQFEPITLKRAYDKGNGRVIVEIAKELENGK
jgi:Holliday junction resolvase RusA-like endonuclease